MIHYSLFGTDQTLPFVACEKILDEQPMREPAVVAVMCREKATHRKGRILYAEQTWPIYFKKGLSLKVAIVDVPLAMLLYKIAVAPYFSLINWRQIDSPF